MIRIFHFIFNKTLFTLFLILLFNCAKAENTIKFVWNSYCPYTCNPSSGETPGYAMEIVVEIFKNSKYKAVFSEIRSWNRAMNMVKNGDSDAIIFTFYPSNAEKLFIVPKEVMAIEKNICFAIRKDSQWKLKNVNSLKNLEQIGVYKDTIWLDKTFTAFEKKHTNKFNYLHGDNIIERAFKMLFNGRIDAWEDAETILKYQIHKRKIKNLRIEKYTLKTVSTGGTLFSKKNKKSKEYAMFLSAGIKKLRKSGKLEKIIKKYGLDLWDKN
ncbi:MAG: amino acid ABC transporter substrate-binding protein [Desulfobacterales bacterium]|nr:amino acid ABC transporter substrate-binding protein [Desulfobacterales bacterium]MCP4159198.1 amino acid ABC transporter substrate-binding protein [Deltaproteobacteria bacterium]